MLDVAAIAAAIGDPLRVRILDLLAAGRPGDCCSPTNPEAPAAVCACDLAPALGGLSPSRLAYHLGLLREAELVKERRQGKWVYYSVDEEAMAGFARSLADRWAPRKKSLPRRLARRPGRRR